MRVGIIVAVILFLVVIGNPFFVVYEYDQVIITQFGNRSGTPTATPVST